MLALIGLIQTSGPLAAAETVPCALVAPKYQTKGGKAIFEITLDCSAVTSKPVPLNTDLLLGLTVYDGANAKEVLRTDDDWFANRELVATPEIQVALKDSVQSNSAQVSGGPKWIVVTDANAASFDFPAKPVRVKQKGEKITVKFEGDLKALGDKRHFLYALWPSSARQTCDKRSKYSRSGCRLNGYVLGDDAGVNPLAAYPGLEINSYTYGGGDWTTERWIVERFR
ncbi:MAG: hypothetical protein FIA97_16445 [Methylococcaceae bacterium]|nr:hypothetical protein [Methylococcaceae bacterium]